MAITITITLSDADIDQICERYTDFAPEPLTPTDIDAHHTEVEDSLEDYVYGKLLELIDRNDDGVFNCLADIFDPEDFGDDEDEG